MEAEVKTELPVPRDEFGLPDIRLLAAGVIDAADEISWRIEEQDNLGDKLQPEYDELVNALALWEEGKREIDEL